jgi:hypothetical protein
MTSSRTLKLEVRLPKIGDVCRVVSDCDGALPVDAVVCVKTQVTINTTLGPAYTLFDCQLLFGDPLEEDSRNLYPYYAYELEVIDAVEA